MSRSEITMTTCCAFALDRNTNNFFVGWGSSCYCLVSVFPLMLGASTGNLSQSFFEAYSGGSLISHLSIVRTVPPVNTPPEYKLLSIPEIVPLQERGVVSTPIHANRVRNGPASA